MALINYERTLSELGIDVLTLSRGSAKYVYAICQACGKEEKIQFVSVNLRGRRMCVTCSNTVNANTNKNKKSKSLKAFYAAHGHNREGQKHTDETRSKIRNHHRLNPYRFTDAQRKKLSDSTTGANNPFYGKHHTPETIEFLRENSRRTTKKGKESNLYGKTFYAKSIDYLAKDGRTHKLKSGWEERVAKFLDGTNASWDYERTAFPVVYEYNGKIKHGTYIPDFFLSNGEIWEVKGYWREDAKIKYDAFRQQYSSLNVKLLMKNELKAMGIKLR